MAQERLQAALDYHALGWSVVPVHTVDDDGKCSCRRRACSSPGKHPRGSWRSSMHTRLTEEQLREHWEQHPESNVGIVTGEISGIAVVDIDGPEGEEALRDAGLPQEDWPDTPIARTGGGGWHLFVAYPEEGQRTRTDALAHVDVRAEGGFVVAPPSKHVSGNNYEWITEPFDCDPEDFDWTLLGEDDSGTGGDVDSSGLPSWVQEALAGVGEGRRNDTAARLAGRYVGMGLGPSEVLALLRGWNERNNPPMPEDELDTVVNSILTREQGGALSREQLIRRVNRVLGLNLVAVTYVEGDSPRYVVEFDEGTCSLTTRQLLSPTEFRTKIAEGTQVIPVTLGRRTIPTQEQMAEYLLCLAEPIDVGDEATEAGETRAILEDFLKDRSIIDLEEEDGIPPSGLFRHDGKIWFEMSALAQCARLKWNTRWDIPELAERLGRLGAVRSEYDGRSVWGVPEEVVPECSV